jgi:hypothetical protein
MKRSKLNKSLLFIIFSVLTVTSQAAPKYFKNKCSKEVLTILKKESRVSKFEGCEKLEFKAMTVYFTFDNGSEEADEGDGVRVCFYHQEKSEISSIKEASCSGGFGHFLRKFHFKSKEVSFVVKDSNKDQVAEVLFRTAGFPHEGLFAYQYIPQGSHFTSIGGDYDKEERTYNDLFSVKTFHKIKVKKNKILINRSGEKFKYVFKDKKYLIME